MEGGGCPHLARLPGAGAELRRGKESLNCMDCGCPGPNLWICLQPDCHHVGCSEVKNDHSTLHQKKIPSHCVHMNVSTERIWCYACEREVHIRAAYSQGKMQMSPDSTSIGGSSGVSRLGFDRAVGLNVSLGDNDDDDDDDPHYGESDTEGRPRGLVGLQNMGNTCYMNAALQALSNTRPLTDYFLECAPAVSVLAQNKKPGLSRSYQKLVKEMWNKKTRGYVVPNGILYGIRNVHPMFRGYHQHDTQEFLRCFMDQLHEELKEPVPELEEHLGADADGDHQENMRNLTDIRQRAASSGSNEASKFFRMRRKSPAPSVLSESRADGYLRVHALSESESQQRGVSRHRRSASYAGMQNYNYSHVPVPDSSTGDVGSESEMSNESEADERYETCSSGGASDVQETQPPRDRRQRKESTPARGSGDSGGMRYRSVISDVFDGKLLSSVQCLICDRVSTRVETFQDLSLPIPSRDHIAVLRSQQPVTHPSQQMQDSWVGMWWLLSWFRSWFYGPVVSLQDCLAAFFSADELKGDNMYSCSRCNKLRNGVKMSGVLRLPEVLCVHLKRFRHELMFSAKVGARVSFPLQDLNMAPYTHKDCTSKISRYELCAVICHAGTAGGGHYTCIARNNRSWYEFDDQCVTAVPRQQVASAEAYVLFYRKVNPHMTVLRQKAAEILEAASCEPNDMKFYISKQWINKFNTWAEPGAIDNSDFVCSHGGVRPDRVEHVPHLAAVVPQPLWEFLHDKFGGGPACTHVHECKACARAAERLRTRRTRELNAFYDLHAIFQKQENPRAIYAISMHWFRQWQAFVRDKTKQPPPPVDNSAIVTKQDNSESSSGPTYVLKQGSDHAQLSEELWRFFTEIYGGGPEVKLKSPNQPPEMIYHSEQTNQRERTPSFRKHSESDKEDYCNRANSEVNVNHTREETRNTQSLQNIDRRYRVSLRASDSDDEFRYRNVRKVSHREYNGNYDSDEEMDTSPVRLVNGDYDANDNPLKVGHVPANPLKIGNTGHFSGDQIKTGNIRHVMGDPLKTSNIGHVTEAPIKTGNVGHVNGDPLKTGNIRKVSGDALRTGNIGHVSEDPLNTGNTGHVSVNMETNDDLPNMDSISLKGKKGKVRRVKKRTVK